MLSTPVYGLRSRLGPRAIMATCDHAVALFTTADLAEQALRTLRDDQAAVVLLNSRAAIAAHLRRAGVEFVTIDPLPLHSSPGVFIDRSNVSRLRVADALTGLKA
jgi:hypothetical protein